MRRVITLLLSLILIGIAGAQFTYLGPEAGFKTHGIIAAEKGFAGSGVANDIGSTDTMAQTVVQAWANPEATDGDQLLNDAAMNQTTNINAVTFLGTIDFPRTIVATLNASSSGTFKITGTDAAGAALTENLTISGGTSATGTKAFKTVTLIQADLQTGETAKTVDIGISDILGLNYKLAANTVVMASLNNVREGTAPTVTASSTTLSLNTIDLNSALNGNPVKAWYMV